MSKKITAFLIVLVLTFSAFAVSNSSNVSVLLGAKVNNIQNNFNVQAASLNLSEIAYLNQNENQFSSPFLRFDAGAQIFFNDEDKPMIGLNGGAFVGYSLGIGPIAKIELAGGAEFFESSVIELLVKKVQKDETYKLTSYIAPAVDLSVFLGLDQVSIRAGIRGSYGITESITKGLSFTPYVGISAKLLQFLNIL